MFFGSTMLFRQASEFLEEEPDPIKAHRHVLLSGAAKTGPVRRSRCTRIRPGAPRLSPAPKSCLDSHLAERE